MMSKKFLVLISVLLILSAIIIESSLENSSSTMDMEIIQFFEGIVIAIGIGLPFIGSRKNKKKENIDGSSHT